MAKREVLHHSSHWEDGPHHARDMFSSAVTSQLMLCPVITFVKNVGTFKAAHGLLLQASMILKRDFYPI